MPRFETWLQTDLKRLPQVVQLVGRVFTGDDEANLIGVAVTDDGQPATLSGNVYGYIVRPDGYTVTLTGELEGNRASILLTSSCYAMNGQISIVIKVGTVTVGACCGYVERSRTDSIIDPENKVPSLEALLEQIDECEEATTAANSAATAANAAASSANGVISGAAEARDNANAAATKINDMVVGVSTSTGTPEVVTTLVNGHYKIQFSGLKGEQGIQGIQGPQGNDITVSSWGVQYGTESTGSTAPSTWSDSIPTVSPGSYLWSKTTTTYSDGTSVVVYGINRQPIDGTGAVSDVDGISPNASGSVALSALRYVAQTLTQAQQVQAQNNLFTMRIIDDWQNFFTPVSGFTVSTLRIRQEMNNLLHIYLNGSFSTADITPGTEFQIGTIDLSYFGGFSVTNYVNAVLQNAGANKTAGMAEFLTTGNVVVLHNASVNLKDVVIQGLLIRRTV